MSANLFAALRRLLPAEPVLRGLVLSHDDTADTSEIQLPAGPAGVPVAEGVTAGNVIRARGRSVAVGSYAFVRGGVVESEAPAGEPLDVVIGTVVADPLGPQGITFSGSVPAQTATVGVAFALPLVGYFSGYYPALTFTLGAGSLAGTGLALDSSTGSISGTPTGTATLAGLRVDCTDATGLAASTNTFSITIGT